MTWFKSRYTESLEEQVIDLKLQLATKEERIAELMAKLLERPQAGECLPVTAAEIIKLSAQRRKRPAQVNLMQARDWLESKSKDEEIHQLTPEEAQAQQQNDEEDHRGHA